MNGSTNFDSLFAQLTEALEQLAELHRQEVKDAQCGITKAQSTLVDKDVFGRWRPAVRPESLHLTADDVCVPVENEVGESTIPQSHVDLGQEEAGRNHDFDSNTPVTAKLSRHSVSQKTARTFRHFYVRPVWFEDSKYSKLTLHEIIEQEKDMGKFLTVNQVYKGKKSHWFLLNPNSNIRGFWLVTCLSLLLYDVVNVPFAVCFEPEETKFAKGFDAFCACFWTVDILLNFITGVRIHDHLEMRWKRIARHYVKSGWFIFDFLIVLPEWLSFFLDTLSDAQETITIFRLARWGRIARLLRLARVARITKLHIFLRHIVITFHLSKQYFTATQGWLFSTIIIGFIVHFLCCFWYALGNSLDNGWVVVNNLDTAYTGTSYIISAFWSVCRLQGIRSGYLVETRGELLADALLIYCSLILSSYYVGKVTTACMSRASSTNLWKAGIAFSARHNVSDESMFRMMKSLEAAHIFGAADIAQEESLLLESLPVILQQDLLFEARSRFLIGNSFFGALFGFNPRAVRHVCNDTMTPNIAVQTEKVFAYADACRDMAFIVTGRLLYFWGRTFDYEDKSEASELAHGSSISEPVLWTTWEHVGHLVVVEETALLKMDTEKFAQVILQHQAPCMHAVRYAKHFVWRLNQSPKPSDLTKFTDLSLDALDSDPLYGTQEDHFMFISHYKVESGTEATLMRDLLGSILHEDRTHPANFLLSPIFIDSEDLTDLAQLKEHVTGSGSLILLLTPSVLSRPWVLIEIVTAIRNGVSVVLVEVQRPGSRYEYPDEEFYAGIENGKLIDQQGVDLLAREGIYLADVVSSLKTIFHKIALPFSPHKTKSVREAELRDILKRCEVKMRQRTCSLDGPDSM